MFNTIWDAKKTHLQLVQRSNDIFKLLLKEGMMTLETLETFWSLTKDEYKSEIFKILGESHFYLKQNHIEFLFEQITLTPAEKLSLAEFDCLCDLGRNCKDSAFQDKISNFFWSIIVDSQNCKTEIVDNCITKFSEMIKYWSLTLKEPFFVRLAQSLKKT